MKIPLFSRLSARSLWAVAVVTAAGAGWFGYRQEEVRRTGALLDSATLSAAAFAASDLKELSGSRADLTTRGYAAVKTRLQRLDSAEPSIRFVYIFRRMGSEGAVVYLTDSAAPGAKDESLPGDDYPQAKASPGLQQILRTGEPATEGPLADDFGTWVTGYAPILDPGVAGPPQEVLGIDIDASTWQRGLWFAAARGAFYVLILLGLPIMALQVSRRQDEQREVIRNLSEAMEQSHSAIIIIDLGHHIEYANRGFCRQIGHSRRELIGRDWRSFRGHETPAEVFSDVSATVQAGHPWEGEWFITRKDGTTYPVRGVVTPVKHRDGTHACFVAVFDDVTETKRREAELREARDLAEAGDRAKGQFLATMSHEVRTPLNGIVGFTSLLLDTSLTAEQRDYVQTIRSSGEALIQLTGDILDYARIESGKLKLDLLNCDPRDCVEEALDLLAMKALERRIELLHRCGSDVPASIMVDGGRLRQVLVNLVGNAVKFTEHGEVEVSVTLLPAAAADPAEKRMLEFKVRDTGIGIAAEQHARLFKPFTQVDDSSTRRHGGTGLGLAISRNLVQLMGGTIGLESEVGRGSTFTFTVAVTVTSDQPPVRDLGGLQVGLAMPAGALRQELETLLTEWRAEVVVVEHRRELVGRKWEIGLVAIDDAAAAECAGLESPGEGLPADNLVGLVPVAMSSDLRVALRTHFRLLMNKPVHHGALYALLAGARTSTPVKPPSLSPFGLRIMVVEDNPMNQRLMQRVLTNLGCTHQVVENGRRAVEELARRAGEFDLVLLDLHMPELDGIATLREIRTGHAGPVAQNMWIVALTADARQDERARAMAAGLNDFLTKPLRMSELQAALRRFREERGARSRPS
jgi:PAS domain S-box-containing protein